MLWIKAGNDLLLSRRYDTIENQILHPEGWEYASESYALAACRFSETESRITYKHTKCMKNRNRRCKRKVEEYYAIPLRPKGRSMTNTKCSCTRRTGSSLSYPCVFVMKGIGDSVNKVFRDILRATKAIRYFNTGRFVNIVVGSSNRLLRKNYVYRQPDFLQLEVSSKCNLKGSMCPRSSFELKNGDFSLENFKKLIDSNPKISHVRLCRFGEPLYNPEFSKIIVYASQKGLDVGCEGFFVEFITSDGEWTTPGEQGRFVVTCIENHAMPFIRYGTGDLGVPSEEDCECGRSLPLIDEVSGRVIELVKTSSDRIISIHCLTLLFEDYSDFFRNFQAVQRKKDYLEVLVEPTSRFTEDVEEDVLERLRIHVGKDMKVEISKVYSIPQTSSGKKMLLISEVE